MKLLGALFSVVAITLSGCATPIPVNTTISEAILMNVKPNNKDAATFNFSSKLPADHTVVMGGFKPQSNINLNYGKMVNEFMQAKFNKTGNDLEISIELVSLDCEQKMDQGVSNTLRALSSLGGEAKLETRIVSTVVVKRKGKEIGRKSIQASSEENYTTMNSNLNLVYSNSINKASNRSLALTNGYLSSLDL